jgi:hypothetical protein
MCALFNDASITHSMQCRKIGWMIMKEVVVFSQYVRTLSFSALHCISGI